MDVTLAVSLGLCIFWGSNEVVLDNIQYNKKMLICLIMSLYAVTLCLKCFILASVSSEESFDLAACGSLPIHGPNRVENLPRLPRRVGMTVYFVSHPVHFWPHYLHK